MRRGVNYQSPMILFATVGLFFAAVSCGGGGSSNSTPTSNPTPTPMPSAVSVTVSPTTASLSPDATQQFNATVTGTSNTAVNWSVALQPGASGNPGTISPNGLYTAPATLLGDNAVVATATAQADMTKSANASIGVIDNHEKEALPVLLGSSGGNSTDSSQSGNKITCCSGTLGSLVSRGGTQFILSNNHVLDRSGQGTIGQPISQPGIADANCDMTMVTPVATLSQAAPLQNAPNNVDAALAEVMPKAVDSAGTILDLDALGQPAPPSAMIVSDPSTLTPGATALAKSGSASGLTCSTLSSIALSVKVTYQKACGDSTNAFTVIFNNEIEVTGGSFSASGDSGSLIVTRDQARPVALLFAGNSDTKMGPLDTVGNPIATVLNALQDSNHVAPTIVGGADHPVACTVNTQSTTTTTDRAAIREEQRNLSATEIQGANLAKSAHAEELMRDSTVTGLDIGASKDNPSEAAVIVYVDHHTAIPHVLSGVRTRIVSKSALPQMSHSQIVQALAIKQQNVEQLMSNPAILAVGVGASLDDPSEPALLIHVQEGKQVVIPPELDGIRTRIKFAQPFKAFGWGKPTTRSCSRK